MASSTGDGTPGGVPVPDRWVPELTTTSRIFISHAGEDIAWAEWVAWELTRANQSVVLDCSDWQTGDNFVSRISVALGSCDALVAICSAAYFEPGRWTTEEWTAALARTKEDPRFRLVLVRIDDAELPQILRSMISVSIFGLAEAEARAKVLRAVSVQFEPAGIAPYPPGLYRETGKLTRSPRLPGRPPSTWGSVPAYNASFTGRDQVLVNLRDALGRAGQPVVTVLHGPSGVGKTQLAIEYTWRFANDYDAVWWIGSSSPDTVREQLAALAVDLELDRSDEDVEAVLQRLRRYFRSTTSWLLVFDNADSPELLRDLIPHGPGHVLVTSRNPHWHEISTEAIEIGSFDRDESVSFLRMYDSDVADDAAGMLADALGDLPLGLAQAAIFMSSTGTPVDEYLRLLSSSANSIMREGKPPSYPLSLAAVVRISVTELADISPAAGQLLNLCAFLAPEPIPTSWFTGRPMKFRYRNHCRASRAIRSSSDGPSRTWAVWESPR